MTPWRVREPRQPQIHKGFVVHTDASPDYDDSTTKRAIDDTISGANQPTNDKEIDMPKGNDNLPNGRQGKDVVHAITTYANVGQTFKAEQVWAWLGQRKQNDWIRAYGGRDKAFSKVKVALNNLNYSGRLGLERSTVRQGVFEYTGKKGTPSDAYKRTKMSRNQRKKEQATANKVPVDKPVSKPATVPEVSRRMHVVTDTYRHIGYDLEGVALYLRKDDDEIGHLVFTPSL